jgi:dihydrofolate reductase
MRKIITAAFLSIDGVMQAPGGPDEDPTGGFEHGGWVVPYADDSALAEALSGLFGQPYDLLLGRKTYDIFAAHWPYNEDGPDAEIAKAFNKCTKYVATTSREPLTWAHSVALRGNVVAEIEKLKRGDGPALVTQGSSVLIQTLLAHDLIDELMTLTFPITLGRGKRLFGEGTKAARFELAGGKIGSKGVVTASFVRDGTVETGTFPDYEPSAAELARRAKWKRQD